MDKHQLYTGGPLVDDLLVRLAKLEQENEDLKKQLLELSIEVHKLRLYVPTY